MQSSRQKIAAVALGILLALRPSAFALDPSLDISQYAHTAWKVRDGFTRSGITSIAQTPDGYLWLGTEYGLLRFDGVKAAPWQPQASRPLPSSHIMSLLVTRDGTLWIGTLNGLASWKDGKLTRYAELDGRYIYALLEDREGVVWVSGVAVPTGRLCAIRKSSVQCYGDNGVFGYGAFSLYEDSKGNLWAGVKDGLWRWKPGTSTFYSLPGESDGIQALGEDAEGKLLVGWKGGIHRFVEGKTEIYSLPGLPRFTARRLLRDRDGGLWITTSNHGLLHVHRGRADDFVQSTGLSGDSAFSLFEDQEGSIWVATLDGLDRFRGLAVATFTVKQGLSNNTVVSTLAARDGVVWLATGAGLNQWTDGRIASFGNRGGKLNGYVPTSLFQDSHGLIWVSTDKGDGYIDRDRFTPVMGIPGGPVRGFAEDTGGNLWIANQEHGLLRLVRNALPEQTPWAAFGHKDYASALVADPVRGGLWLGFHSGGISYFKEGRTLIAYTGWDGLGEGRVNSLRLDTEGALWAATDGGLSRVKNRRIATLTTKNGLPCDFVHWSMEDDVGSVWLYTPCGLVRIAHSDVEEWAIATDRGKGGAAKRIQTTVLDSSDGVRTHGASGGYGAIVAKSKDGKLWFLPWDGISVVDPRHFAFNKLPPPVHVEQITADRKIYDVASQMRLPPQVHDLQIDYTALSLAAPEKVLFRYKLEGFDSDWLRAGSRRQAFYTNLSPGKYRFRVAACNNSGVWNEEGATLDFSIAPAYYQTIWFRASCVFVFLALLWSLYQLRRRQLQQQFNMRLNARVNERTRIARELHDTLLQSFHGLMFRFQAARNMLPGRPEEASQALDGAILRAEQAIAEGRSAIQDLRPAAGAQADLAQSLTTIGQELARQDQGHGSPLFQVVVEGERRKLSRTFQEELYRMGRELLQNAFQHARAREIEAEVRYEPRIFRLLIRDDGKGIDPNVLEQGGRPGHWGLPGIRERAEQIGAEVDFWSEADAGTEIQLTVPASIAYEEPQDGSGFRLFRKKKSHEHHS